jgi:hypothetical protein
MGDIGLTNSFDPVLFNVPESFTGGPPRWGEAGASEAGSLMAAFAKRETG